MSVKMQELQMKMGLGLRPGAAYANSFEDFEKEFLGARGRRMTVTTERAIQAHKEYRQTKNGQIASNAIWDVRMGGVRDLFADAVGTQYGFADRMLFFWLDHFAVRPKNHEQHVFFIAYIQDALRKNMSRTFAELLTAVITHPMMLIFLDQATASAPNSKEQSKLKVKVPANENLARELLELHTLGSTGPYTQADVKQTSLLLAGLRYTYWSGVTFGPWYAEPGPKRILGKVYNPKSQEPSLSHLKEFLKHLSVHPKTIDYICRKLVTHFVSDKVDQQIVNAMKAEWTKTKGNLMSVTKVMLRHNRVLQYKQHKAKRPLDFILSSLRALSVPANRMKTMKNWELNDYILKPMALMGQDIQAVPGPNGWPEDVSSWINAGNYAARIEWANRVPQRLLGSPNLPSPATFVQRALGSFASAELKTAVPRGSNRRESTTVFLASRDFNRR